ncbi:MAG: transglutaminase family protein [Hydrogenophaga sp.]|uniref:transglutaminase family protein n=1 Tax=Hydrogenophaga sp. TaxID=1904254 RepID=UPI002A3668D7|nr:transglutaminase family protein [Hydrogenophaga sp.]MDX9967409.1 transglutaminase family protein [Hydrogenophaga sp.]
MKLHVRHTTRYHYTEPLRYSVQALHLWPASGACQTVLDWCIRAPAAVVAQPDCLGNHVHAFSLVARPEHNLRELSVIAEGVVQTHGVAEFEDPPGLPHPLFYRRPTAHAESHPRLAAWARQQLPEMAADNASPSVAGLVRLASAVADQVRYQPGRTAVETTALEAFDWGLGVCQDQAHVMVAVCRSLGWPARYVSGYFHTASEPGLASHAWADVCIDVAAARWVSLDVTHRCLIDERHIRLAAASDYTACPPIKGVRRGGGSESMAVTVTIGPVA